MNGNFFFGASANPLTKRKKPLFGEQQQQQEQAMQPPQQTFQNPFAPQQNPALDRENLQFKRDVVKGAHQTNLMSDADWASTFHSPEKDANRFNQPQGPKYVLPDLSLTQPQYQPGPNDFAFNNQGQTAIQPPDGSLGRIAQLPVLPAQQNPNAELARAFQLRQPPVQPQRPPLPTPGRFSFGFGA